MIIQNITIHCHIFRMAADIEQRGGRVRSNSAGVRLRLGANQGRRRLQRNNTINNFKGGNSEKILQRSFSQARAPRARSRSTTNRAVSRSARPRSVSRNRNNTNNNFNSQKKRQLNRSSLRGNRASSRGPGAVQNRLGVRKSVNPINARKMNQQSKRMIKSNVRNTRRELLQNQAKRQVFKHLCSNQLFGFEFNTVEVRFL